MCLWRHWELVWLWGKQIAWQTGLTGGTGGRRKLCMVACHSCYIYGTWRSKKSWGGGRGGFKVIKRGKGGNFYGGS